MARRPRAPAPPPPDGGDVLPARLVDSDDLAGFPPGHRGIREPLVRSPVRLGTPRHGRPLSIWQTAPDHWSRGVFTPSWTPSNAKHVPRPKKARYSPTIPAGDLEVN